jgi:hypothetical protein
VLGHRPHGVRALLDELSRRWPLSLFHAVLEPVAIRVAALAHLVAFVIPERDLIVVVREDVIGTVAHRKPPDSGVRAGDRRRVGHAFWGMAWNKFGIEPRFETRLSVMGSLAVLRRG